MAEVLSVMPDGPSHFSPSPLRRSSASQTSLFSSSPRSFSPQAKSRVTEPYVRVSSSTTSSGTSSPRLSRHDSSVDSTPASSLSLDTPSEDEDEDEAGTEDNDKGICFPSYDNGSDDGISSQSRTKTDGPTEGSNAQRSGPPSSVTPDEHPAAEDDTAVRPEPSQHVDYLSHDWEEGDIAASWRHIVSKRKIYGERSRLENASWRTWAKSKNNLKTVSPETLNWLKDCDVTWLYGPLQTAQNRTLSMSNNASEPASRLSKSNSFLVKKPILKKRSVSELMLQKSISASSLVKQAADAVQAQQTSGHTKRNARPIFDRTISDFISSSSSSKTASRDLTDCFSSPSSSGLHTPDHGGEKKHIRFDDKVEQCIAVDVKDGDFDEEDDWTLRDDDDGDSSDDGMLMMRPSKNKKQSLSRSHSRSSFSGENKIIEKLEPTTLKYRTDSPDVTEHATSHSLAFFRSSRLSPSPSQETLRPSNPTMNFLLPEDDDAAMSWEPSRAFSSNDGLVDKDDDHHGANSVLRRTGSGMFMPLEDDNDLEAGSGILGRVVDTVNTARDIAHVIWNVGWRN